eukprot:5329192-Pleurochrysis_carterae.AAC.2
MRKLTCWRNLFVQLRRGLGLSVFGVLAASCRLLVQFDAHVGRGEWEWKRFTTTARRVQWMVAGC